ncbi:hypothetical protein [Thalassococcus arenae]|nr:hypothetical protein [Thalassococcus arenae]
MYDIVKSALIRAEATLVQDAIGAVSLAVILVGALHLPAMI